MLFVADYIYKMEQFYYCKCHTVYKAIKKKKFLCRHGNNVFFILMLNLHHQIITFSSEITSVILLKWWQIGLKYFTDFWSHLFS